MRVSIDITFSEACTKGGGFKCINASSCDVLINGPAEVNASTLKMVEQDIKYRIVVEFSASGVYGRVVVKMADMFCTDEAGNQFRRTNESVLILHFDRRPVDMGLWTTIPSYELKIGEVPRTVLATNKLEDLEFYLDFSSPVVNLTDDIQSVLHANFGSLVPIKTKGHGGRRFVFRLVNVTKTDIITVKVQPSFIIGQSGTAASSVEPIAFLYGTFILAWPFDSPNITRPSVRLTTRFSGVTTTKEFNIQVVAEFSEPVFGFQASGIEVVGGSITRQVIFEEHTKTIFSLVILGGTENEISVFIPEGKANDISGNLNLASNQLEIRQYSTPAISALLHSFATAGLLATSLAAALLTFSSTNLAAIGALSSGTSNVVISDPSMNLLGMVGHLQLFAFSDRMSRSLPLEYTETTRGLRWLIPCEDLPWKKEKSSIWNYYSLSNNENELLLSQQDELALAVMNGSEISGLQELPNVSIRNTSYGQPLDADEYFIHFMRQEPLAAMYLMAAENYTGWRDLEMNLFWLGIGCGGLLISHFLVVLLLTWRTGTSVHWTLSVPRFELFLLILILPCISQSAAFVLRGHTTAGIITGALLLAIPVAVILSVSLFLIVAVFTSNFVQYKEITYTNVNKPWNTKVLDMFIGNTTQGKWFYKEGLPSSFLPRFGLLFEDRKGPPILVSVDHNDSNNVRKWTYSSESGIGRMKVVNIVKDNEEAKISLSTKLLGCSRSAYVILDLLRRVTLGFISGAYSSPRSSQSIVAFSLTVVQLLCLLSLRPYIRRGIHVAESLSLLCEAAVFGLFIYMGHKSSFEDRTMGIIMLILLFTNFLAQLVNEWYALIKCLLELPQLGNISFSLGVKCVAKGLILPFLPRKHWPRFLPGSSQPKTGLVPVIPLGSETRDIGARHIDHPLSAMSATIVPVLSPAGSSSVTKIQAQGRMSSKTQFLQKEVEEERLKGIVSETNNEARKLKQLAKASFPGFPVVEVGSCSYSQEIN
ncbi:hypothetical protein C5167_021840 [Papaver somniferum]|uniref:Bacterial Ig-like domain-containing protein n=1 Tax=Papaver somniferum TaxID=3469 RepID=A0A4Y7JG03_PAPSO|nr:hypothetical protein C5167_021840 [Papaver somniferum]